jgi:hypothetical protein
MGRWNWTAGIGLAAALMVAGCEDDGKDSCGDFGGCGGDLVGEWKAESLCGGGSLSVEGCAVNVPIDLGGLTTTGAITFNSDRTYRSTLGYGGSMIMHWPKACLMVMGITLTCQQLNAGINQAMMQDPDPNIASITCSDESSGCACLTTLRTVPAIESGRYSSSGTTLTTTADQPDIEPETMPYCVQNDTLKLQFLPVDMNDDLRGGMTLKK